MRLSFKTVSWPARVFALMLALLTAMLLFLPAAQIHYAMLTGTWSLQGLGTAFLSGLAISIVGFPFLIPIGILFFGVPALLMNHIALWLRCNLFGFVAAGISAALLGFIILGIYEHGVKSLIREMMSQVRYREDWSLAETIRMAWVRAVICGGGGAAVAWCFMRGARRRPD